MKCVHTFGTGRHKRPADITLMFEYIISIICMGAHWLSGRVLDWRPRGSKFESHKRHCVVSLNKTH